jgi:hypothetical protein
VVQQRAGAAAAVQHSGGVLCADTDRLSPQAAGRWLWRLVVCLFGCLRADSGSMHLCGCSCGGEGSLAGLPSQQDVGCHEARQLVHVSGTPMLLLLSCAA